MEEWLRPRTQDFLDDWDRAADRERASRSLFAQHGIRVEEVAKEVAAVREAIGGAVDVEAFVRAAVASTMADGRESGTARSSWTSRKPRCPYATLWAASARSLARFELPVTDGEVYLSRTHPVVDGAGQPPPRHARSTRSRVARRGALRAIRTAAVRDRTVLLLVRHPLPSRHDAAGRGERASSRGLRRARVRRHRRASPTGCDSGGRRHAARRSAGRQRLGRGRHATSSPRSSTREAWQPHLDDDAPGRAAALLDAHERVRAAARQRGVASPGRAPAPARRPGHLPAASARLSDGR